MPGWSHRLASNPRGDPCEPRSASAFRHFRRAAKHGDWLGGMRLPVAVVGAASGAGYRARARDAGPVFPEAEPVAALRFGDHDVAAWSDRRCLNLPRCRADGEARALEPTPVAVGVVAALRRGTGFDDLC